MNNFGKVYLTGAGPGDIEMLTLKALKIVKQADVIIYDRLANPDILEFAKDGCEFIYVGKKDSQHTLPQDKINETIYQAACKYKNVCRLKGGDPFVFGRGGEEAIYLSFLINNTNLKPRKYVFMDFEYLV